MIKRPGQCSRIRYAESAIEYERTAVERTYSRSSQNKKCGPKFSDTTYSPIRPATESGLDGGNNS